VSEHKKEKSNGLLLLAMMVVIFLRQADAAPLPILPSMIHNPKKKKNGGYCAQCLKSFSWS
jgi:hypothetical protein